MRRIFIFNYSFISLDSCSPGPCRVLRVFADEPWPIWQAHWWGVVAGSRTRPPQDLRAGTDRWSAVRVYWRGREPQVSTQYLYRGWPLVCSMSVLKGERTSGQYLKTFTGTDHWSAIQVYWRGGGGGLRWVPQYLYGGCTLAMWERWPFCFRTWLNSNNKMRCLRTWLNCDRRERERRDSV